MKIPILTSILPLIALFGCGESTDTRPASATACPPTHTVAVATDLNYPRQDCAQATARAEGQLDGLHYRKACQAADPGAALPPSVAAARVTDCRTTDGRGVFLDVEICCPEAVEQALIEPESVVRAEGPKCPSWRTRARMNGLHYPDAGSCNAIVSQAEAELGSIHYRKACKSAAPRSSGPASVLRARVVECRSGGVSSGVSIDVELCCEGKVFEESDFRELGFLASASRMTLLSSWDSAELSSSGAGGLCSTCARMISNWPFAAEGFHPVSRRKANDTHGVNVASSSSLVSPFTCSGEAYSGAAIAVPVCVSRGSVYFFASSNSSSLSLPCGVIIVLDA